VPCQTDSQLITWQTRGQIPKTQPHNIQLMIPSLQANIVNGRED